MASPPLLPGCLVTWFDTYDACHVAMVIQFEEQLYGECYSLIVLREQRIKPLVLFHKDVDKRWRVLHRG